MAVAGLGELLALAKQHQLLGAGAPWGWGQQATELGAVTPQAARAPQTMHSPALSETYARGF